MVQLIYVFLIFCSLIVGIYSECPTGCTCSQDTYDCHNSKHKQLPESIDEGISTLVYSGSKLVFLDLIPEAPGLANLDLSDNKINNISFNAFDNLDDLRMLILSNNKLDRIMDDVFEWNPLHLNILRLDSNRLEFIPHFLFYDLEELTELDLQNNLITFIHPHAFLRLKSLVRLRLDQNHLHTFNYKWVTGLTPGLIQTLNFENNPWSCDCDMISQLHWFSSTDWFQTSDAENPMMCTNMNGVKVVDTTENILNTNTLCQKPDITGISEQSTLYEGQSVQLQCIFDKSLLPYPTLVWTAPNGDKYKLQTADRFDGIEVTQEGALTIHKLDKEVDDGKYLCTVTNSQGSKQAETTVNVKLGSGGSSSLTTTPVPTVVVDNETDISVNGDTHCPKECVCASQNTDCSSNDVEKELTEVPPNLDQNSVTISLASNQISTINKFATMERLEELRLDNNIISTIAPQAFDGLKKLTTLTMRDNRLKNLPDNIFAHLDKLSILVLDNNELGSIPKDMFMGLKSLQWLYVRHNHLAKVEVGALSPLINIRFIHFENNDLTYINKEVIQPLTELKTIKKLFVSENMFICDCNMEETRIFIRTNDFILNSDLFADGIICKLPSTYADQDLSGVTDALTCNSDDKIYVSGTQPSENKSSSMAGLWFGGLIVGIVLCIAGLVVWKKKGWKIRFGSRKYRHVPGIDDADEASSLTHRNIGSGSEAFV